ncbi:MAG: tail-specific protease [Deltaproteobacteria bacterium]|nr:tail-specific protease [Deltaproteobacteria bacterium]
MHRIFRILCFFIFSFIAISCSAKESAQSVRAQNPPCARTRSIPSPLSVKAPLASKDYQTILTPTKQQSLTCIDIIDNLRHRHYRRVVVDDRLSSKVFDRYLSELDGSRSYFLLNDVSEFEAYRHRLDDALKAGELEPAFKIFNRYQQRVIERLVFIINRMERGLEPMVFDIEESVDTDRKDAPWPANATALDGLWRKRLKNDVLNLKLTGKSLEEIGKLLNQRYRSRLNRISQTNSEDVFAIYINALAGTYDPHTRYFTPRMSENFDIAMSLSLEGIGAVLQRENEYIKVIRLVPAGPADKGKALKPGDRIVGIGQGPNGEVVDVIGWRLDDAVQLIRGPKETIVRLKIIPVDANNEQETKIIGITRDTVNLEEQRAQKKVIDLEHEGRTYKIGIIDIPTFYIDFKAAQSGNPEYRSTARDVLGLLKELFQAKVNGIVIDLRDNGGGSLRQANRLTGLFIETGPTVQVRKVGGQIAVEQDKDPKIAYKGPMVVLINRLSASATEIFAGAIQDYQRGFVVGTRTFGKGTVQTLMDLERGKLKLTAAKFYRVSGKSTQHKGVVPDIAFPAIYDVEKIGESALTDALPWDQVGAVDYQSYANLWQSIPLLRARHESRIKHSPDFAYLIADMKRLKKMRQQTKFSLKETTRRQERERSDQLRLALENKRRIAKGLKPLEKANDLKRNDEPDPFLTEAQYILLDLITLSKETLAKH